MPQDQETKPKQSTMQISTYLLNSCHPVLVLCWVDINQKTGWVQGFSDLEKCSRQQGLYQSVVETKLIHWRTADEPLSYWYRLIQAELSWTVSQVQKISNEAGLRLMLTQHATVKFSDSAVLCQLILPPYSCTTRSTVRFTSMNP